MQFLFTVYPCKVGSAPELSVVLIVQENFLLDKKACLFYHYVMQKRLSVSKALAWKKIWSKSPICPNPQ